MPAKRGKPAKRAKGPAKKGTKARSSKSGQQKAKRPAVKRAKRAARKAKATPAAAAPARPAPGEKREHRISRDAAADLLKRHRAGTRRARGATPAGAHGGVFSAEAIRALLDQPGVEYMRFYYCKHEDGSPGIVLAANDAQMNDLAGDAMLLNNHWVCPPFCPTGGSTILA